MVSTIDNRPHNSAGVGIIDLSSPYVYSNYFYGNYYGVGFGRGNVERAETLPTQPGSPGPAEVTIDLAASATDDYYKGMLLVLDDSSVGSPQESSILDYDGSSQVLTINQDWETPPLATEGYSIY